MDRPQVAALIVSGAHLHSSKAPTGPAEPCAPIAGLSIHTWMIDAMLRASVRRIAVIGNAPDPATRTEMEHRADSAVVEFVIRARSNDTEVMADALQRLGPDLSLLDSSHVIVLGGESPQLEATELRMLIDEHVARGASATILGPAATDMSSDEPLIDRDADGIVRSIVDPMSLPSTNGEIGIFRAPLLVPALRRVTPRGWDGPPLVQDAGDTLERSGHPVVRLHRDEPLIAIETMAERAVVEVQLRDRIVATWIDRGVFMPDPRAVHIDARATIGHGVELCPGTVIEGPSVIADGAVIGPNSHVVDATIGAGARVPHSVVSGTDVAAHTRLAPFSVLGDLAR
ncbi:MAG: hypothetical protein ACR2P0_11275 [Acidimicrobiales bacterium]